MYIYIIYIHNLSMAPWLGVCNQGTNSAENFEATLLRKHPSFRMVRRSFSDDDFYKNGTKKASKMVG